MAIAPIAGYLSYVTVRMDLFTNMQLLSYVGVILILLFRNKTQPIRFPRYLLFYLFFIAYIFYSTFYQLDRDFKIKYLFSYRLIGGFNFMFIIENLPISRKQYRFILKLSVKVLVVAIVVILIQEVSNPVFFVNQNFSDYDRIAEIDKSKNRLFSIYSWIGGYTAIGFGFVPVWILFVEDLNRRKKKIVFWIFAGIIFAFLSKARWIMLNALMVFVILVVNQKHKMREITKYAIIVPLIGIGSLILLDSVGINATKILNDRILENDKNSINKTSAGTRILAFKAFNALFWDSPFFGVGSIKYGMGGTGQQDYKLRSFLKGRSAQMHVGYVSLLYMYGIVGAIFFNGFLYFLLRRLYRNAKKTRIWAPFLGFAGLAVANLTLVHFATFEMGLLIVLLADRYYMNQNITYTIDTQQS